MCSNNAAEIILEKIESGDLVLAAVVFISFPKAVGAYHS